MKKVLSVLLALCLLVGVVPLAASADQAGSSDFVINENGVLTAYNGPGGDVVIPEGVVSIGADRDGDPYLPGANVDKITTITLPSTFTTRSRYVFEDCTSLTAFYMPVPNDCYKVVDGVLFAHYTGFDDFWELYRYPLAKKGPYVIPSNINQLNWQAFAGCTGLTDIDFSQCGSLNAVRENAFEGCTGLTHVDFPSNIEYFWKDAFKDCSNLKYITISRSFDCWQDNVFTTGCTSLKDLYYEGTEEEWNQLLSRSAYAPTFPEDIRIHFNSTGPNDVQPTPSPTPGITITIRFDSNGGSGSIEELVIPNGSAFEVPECSFTPPEGKSFDYWEMMGAGVVPGTSFTFEFLQNREIILKAHWKGPSFTPDYACKEVFDLVNQERAKQGLPAYKANSVMNEAADVRAKELAKSYSHTRPNGTSCITVMDESGIRYAAAGENIAMGQRTPESVMDDWMNSPGHRGNILGRDFDYIGIGHYQEGYYHYWVQLFAGYSNLTEDGAFDNVAKPTSTPTPTPSPAPTQSPTPAPTPSAKPTAEPTPSTPATPSPQPTNAPTPKPNFSDMPSNRDFVNAINWAVNNEITTGTGGGKFSPDKGCTRAQIVTFLWRSIGRPDGPVSGAFSDMPTNSDFQKAISWAASNGVTTGTGGGKFSPDKGCTRAEIVTFLWRAAGRPNVPVSSSFSDMPSNSDFRKAISWAVANGITKGTGNGKFSPNATCTRAQAVTFLYRAQKA